jgi:hypothetical protein
MKRKKNRTKKEDLKNISTKEFDSVIRQILSAPPQVKKKKEHEGEK